MLEKIEEKLEKFKNFIYRKVKSSIIRTSYYEIVVPILLVLLILFYGIISGSLKFSDFILLATFGALSWYSLETRQLKNVARTTNELQQLPFFSLIYKENQNFILKNEGRGVAYNIAIDLIGLGDKFFKFEGSFGGWYYCASGEKQELSIMISSLDGSNRSGTIKDFIHAVFENVKNKKVKFTIRFNSPLKNRHYQTIILKIPNDPVNIENIEIYNFE